MAISNIPSKFIFGPCWQTIHHYPVQNKGSGNLHQGSINLSFAPVSYLSLFKNTIEKVIEAVVTLFLYLRGQIKPLSLTLEQKQLLGKLEENELNPNIQAALSKILKFKRLDPSVFEIYKEQIEKSSDFKDVVYLDTFFLYQSLGIEKDLEALKKNKSEEKIGHLKHLEVTITQGTNKVKTALKFIIQDLKLKDHLLNLPPGKKLYLFPIVLEGLLENHIVLFAYDSQDMAFHYYDSQGLPIQASQRRKMLAGDYSLGSFVHEIRNLFSDTESVYENTQKHQRNSLDCGVYVFNQMRNLMEKIRLKKTESKENSLIRTEANGQNLMSNDPVYSSAEGRKDVANCLLPVEGVPK